MEAEIKSLIEQQGKAFMDFKSRTDTEIKELGAALDEIAKKQNRPPDAGGYYSATSESKAALGRYVRVGEVPSPERKTWTEASDSAGIIVPTLIANEVMAVAKKFSPLRQICKVVSIDTAPAKYTQPVIVDGAPAGWVGETDARPATDAPSIEGVAFPDGEQYVNIPITQWVEEDSQAGQLVVNEIGKAFGRTEGEAFVSGNGSKKPYGFLSGTPVATGDATRAFGTLQYIPVTGTGTVIEADDLVTMLYSLLPEYRTGAWWVMNSTTLSYIRKLKNGTGDYLWSDALVAGQPGTLLGYPVLEANHMPDIAADAFPVAFGDFQSGYCIVDRAMSLLRDPYSNKPYINLYARKRVSGSIVDSNAIRLLKIAAA